jgi:OOP family OmpA-OmpF porin
MKKNFLITAFVLSAFGAMAQSKNHKFGITAGGFIQQYNGNLGSSFFKFDATCFAGVTGNFGMYLDKSFDLSLGTTIGHFGYCQTPADATRVVSLELRCPGCTDRLGMGELRSLMVSGNVALRYKFTNGYLLGENSKLAPYLYTGFGISHLSDVMKRDCVNVGTHFTLNGGIGVKYNITERVNLGYTLAIGCFMTKKVYYTNPETSDSHKDPIDVKIEKRKDLHMQNAITLGFNF